MTRHDSSLQVLTWNIWGHFGPWPDRWPAILATLTDIDPDVICLNEVWGDEDGNQAAELAGALSLDHVYGSGGPRSGRTTFGNAIVTRLQVLESERRMLPVGHGQEPRLVLRTALDTSGGATQVYCTHLSWEFESSDLRQQQVRALAAFVSERYDPTGLPPIVCGDLNADPWSDEVRLLTGQSTPAVPGIVFQDAWELAGDGSPGHTWDRRNPHLAAPVWPNRRLDYILVGWPRDTKFGTVDECRLAGTEPIADTQPSDHYAVVAHLAWGP